MNIHTRLALAALTAFMPITAMAVAPANVAGIRAQNVDGKVTVYWNPVEGDIKNYRVFYSHASILEEGGVYDDYEDAPGNVMEYTLTSVPPVATLYVSVLAVAQDGTESPLFMEEVKVQLTAASVNSSQASVASFSSEAPVAMDSSVLRLLVAESTSATGVTLTFSHALSIPTEFKDTAFGIRSGSGVELPVVRYRLEGNKAILDTALQTAGRVYQVSIHGSIAGKTSKGDLVPQEDAMAPLLFTGLATNLSVADVQNLTLTLKGNTVEASWMLPQTTIRELQIQQSTNGGRTFGTAARLDKAAKGVSIPNVPKGTLTLLVRTVGIDGTLSRGAQQTITIGTVQASSSSKSTSAASSSKSSVSSKPTTKPGNLPSSGLGLSLVIGLSGATAGLRFMRKKNA